MPDGSFQIAGRNDGQISPVEPTLADLLAALQGDLSLSKANRDAWCCSVRRIASFLERDPSRLIARLSALRYGIERLHHEQLDVAQKTLRNHIANLKRALRYFKCVKKLTGRGVPMSPVWEGLYDRLPKKRLRLGLSGFLRYCSALDIEPGQVSDATVAAFIAYASEYQFTNKPKNLHKQVARCWNRACDRVGGWPTITLTEPDHRRRPHSLPWEAFPESFVADVECYLAQLGGKSILDEEEDERSCKQSTVDTRRDYLKLAASAAVKQGTPIEALRSLADLVTPDVVKLILEHYIAVNDGEIKTFTIDMAERLRSVARQYVKAPEADIEVLNRLCFKLGRKRHSGLTPKNMAVIRQLKDPETRRLLLRLADQLFQEALAERDAPIKAAVKAQMALAIRILLFAPMRIGNLAALDTQTSLVRTGGKNPAYHLVIPREDVKNEVALEYPLPASVNEMLRTYLATFRPRLCRTENDWLFPGEGEDHKTKDTLSPQIKEVIRKRTGIRITPHQFRHFAAALILEKDPGNYEFVRRVLGHKNLETTIRFYVGLETIDAVRQFSKLVLEEDA